MPRCTDLSPERKPCRANALPGEVICAKCKRRREVGEFAETTRGAYRTQFMPDGMRERAHELLKQHDTYDLTAELATMQLFFVQLTESLAPGEPLKRWSSFCEQLDIMEANWKYALKPTTYPVQYGQFARAFRYTKALAQQCRNDRQIRDKLESLSITISKLQEKQVAIDAKLQEFVPAEDVRSLFAALLTAAYEAIPDEHHAIRTQLARSIRAQFTRANLQKSVKTRRVVEEQQKQYAKELAQPAIIDVTPIEHDPFAQIPEPIEVQIEGGAKSVGHDVPLTSVETVLEAV